MEDLTYKEIRLVKTLKGKSRMEQDEIIADYEKELKENDTELC